VQLQINDVNNEELESFHATSHQPFIQQF